MLNGDSRVWIAIGFIGQAFFFSRFLVQWIVSERKRKSVIPTSFWYFSIVGGLILFGYSVHRRDPVFITGQSIGLIVYFRNLWLIHLHKNVRPT